jgi:transcriptional regulator with XRE-family HTH domain
MGTAKFTQRPCPTCGTPQRVIDGQWLRTRRKVARIGLREMARRLGFSAPYISDIELNRRNCSAEILKAYEALI